MNHDQVKREYLKAYRAANGEDATLIPVGGGFQVNVNGKPTTGLIYSCEQLEVMTARLKFRATMRT